MVTLVPLALLGSRIRREHHAKGVQVVYLLEGDVLGLHLVPDRIWGLDPFPDSETESGLAQGSLYRLDEIVDLPLEVGDVLADQTGDLLVSVRFLVFEPDVLHLGLDLIKTKPVGERNEYEHRLAKNLIPLVLGHGIYCPAIM